MGWPATRLLLGALFLASACDSNSGSPANHPQGDGGSASEPEVLFDLGQGEPLAVHVDDQFVYFSGRGGDGFQGASIKRGPKAGGGAFEAIGAWNGQKSANLIESDATDVYWLAGSMIERFHKADGKVDSLPLDGRTWDVLADDGDALYLATTGCKSIGRFSKDTAALSTTDVAEASGTGSATLLVVDVDTAYCAHLDRIFAMPKAGGDARVLLSDQEAIATLTQDERNLYWIDTGASISSPQRIATMPKAGGTAVELASHTPGGPSPVMYLDEGHGTIFWKVASSFKSDINALSLNDHAIRTVLSGHAPSGGFTSDGEYLYWAEKEPPYADGRGLVYRMKLSTTR